MISPEQHPNHDVRMRGFVKRASVRDALNWLDDQITLRGSENVSLSDAANRVLAESIRAPIHVPAFDRSAMDGYALRAAETQGASDYLPLPFAICGQSMPGKPYVGKLPRKSAVKIMTGAPIPAGADAVVPAEYATLKDDVVEISEAVPIRKHIGHAGEDIRQGEEILRQGRKLRPQDTGVLASLGIAEVPVISRPRVRILITGNEIVQPGQPKQPFQIYDANSSLLQALVTRDGGVIESHLYLPDDPHTIRTALAATGADVILVSGGSSVGEEDHAPLILNELGELGIHGIAMRPSSPTGIGRIHNTIVLMLPGNPVSCLCAYDFFAGRTIRIIGGCSADWPYQTKPCSLRRKIVSSIGRVDYCRVLMTNDAQVEPVAISGASMLSSTTRADGFVLVPAESEGYPAGAEVSVFLYEFPGSRWGNDTAM